MVAAAPAHPATLKAEDQQKAADPGAKSHAVYIEVGSFKDETWAMNAVEKLNQAGFHAVVLHKTLLWAQSFHVEVGPFSDPKEMDVARQNLSAHGYKPRVVN